MGATTGIITSVVQKSMGAMNLFLVRGYFNTGDTNPGDQEGVCDDILPEGSALQGIFGQLTPAEEAGQYHLKQMILRLNEAAVAGDSNAKVDGFSVAVHQDDSIARTYHFWVQAYTT